MPGVGPNNSPKNERNKSKDGRQRTIAELIQSLAYLAFEKNATGNDSVMAAERSIERAVQVLSDSLSFLSDQEKQRFLYSILKIAKVWVEKSQQATRAPDFLLESCIAPFSTTLHRIINNPQETKRVLSTVFNMLGITAEKGEDIFPLIKEEFPELLRLINEYFPTAEKGRATSIVVKVLKEGVRQEYKANVVLSSQILPLLEEIIPETPLKDRYETLCVVCSALLECIQYRDLDKGIDPFNL
ncbi:MAG: hypothetical protein D6780_01535, partial [Candidatus Dadabacteria bacterium]